MNLFLQRVMHSITKKMLINQKIMKNLIITLSLFKLLHFIDISINMMAIIFFLLIILFTLMVNKDMNYKELKDGSYLNPVKK